MIDHRIIYYCVIFSSFIGEKSTYLKEAESVLQKVMISKKSSVKRNREGKSLIENFRKHQILVKFQQDSMIPDIVGKEPASCPCKRRGY